MKNLFITILFLQSFSAFSNQYTDSLWSVIRSYEYSDSLKLEAYEDITKYFLHENKDSCRTICEEGMGFSKMTNNARFEWSFYNRIGISYIYEDNYQETANYWIKALEIAEMAHDTFTIAQTINNLGALYDTMKEYEKAIEHYSRSLLYKQQNNDYFGMAMTQMSICICLGYLKQYKKANTVIHEVLKLVEQIEDHNDKQKIYTNIGLYYSYIGTHFNILRNVFKGLKYFALAETELENTDNIMDKISNMINIGEVYLYLNDTLSGFKYINDAKLLAKKNHALQKQSVIFEILNNYYFEKENYKLAYYYNDSMQQINDVINSTATQIAIEDISTKYESEKKERENLQLKQEVRDEEIENDRQKRINTIILCFLAVLALFGAIVSSLSYRLRNKNTELTKNKNELIKLNDYLKISKEETEKALEFKSLFLANMSHEIRTPLNIIIGFNNILRKNLNDPKLASFTEAIEMSSYNLLRFLNDILDMSKIEAGKLLLNPENINIRSLVNDIHELFLLKTSQKNIDFIVDIDESVPPRIIIDEVRLRQILVNLIGNAIKFTEHGYIKIHIDSPQNANYHIEFSTTKNIRIQITDTGVGIKPDDFERIFESFRQVNIKEQKQLGGTGLGLPISKRLTEMMNGVISVESKRGQGSTFSILFSDVPLGDNSNKNRTEKINLTENLDYEFTGGTLLIADDEELNRNLIKVCFENTNVTVIEAVNGEEAIESAKQNNPDVILMDVKMPVIDGIEATSIIKKDENLKHIQIIAVSASNIFDRLDNEHLKMFSGLITKPVCIDELYEKMAEFLAHKAKLKANALNLSPKSLMDHFANDKTKITPIIIDTLTGELSSKWSHIFGTNSMNGILEFTTELNEFAIKNDLKEIQAFAEQIMKSGKNFDTEKVNQLLKQYPEIVNLLKL